MGINNAGNAKKNIIPEIVRNMTGLTEIDFLIIILNMYKDTIPILVRIIPGARAIYTNNA